MPFSSQILEDQICSALQACYKNDKPAIPVLAREFDILYHTLRGRINGRKSKTDHAGDNKALKPEQE
jgi:hypothetical protein